MIGIVGAGAVGTVVASRLAPGGGTLLFVRAADDAGRIARDGLRVNDEPPVRVDVTAEPARAAACDVLLVAVKTTATPSLAAFAEALRPGTLVVTLQNGIENEIRLRAALGIAADVVLAPTMTSGTLVLGGRVRSARVGLTTLGRPAPPSREPGARHEAQPSLEPLAERLRAAGLPVAVAADVRVAVWSKLVVNGAINALAALAGVTNGGLIAEPSLRARTAELAREAAAVAASLGIAVPFTDPVAHVEAAIRATAENRNSMLADLEAGRPTEIDALNGAIARAAVAAGVAAGAHEEMVARIRARERASAT